VGAHGGSLRFARRDATRSKERGALGPSVDGGGGAIGSRGEAWLLRKVQF
jgi:hypothetical protein